MAKAILDTTTQLPGTTMNNLPMTQNSRIAALRARASNTVEQVEVWQPEPGETLAGEYTGHIQVEHPRYGTQWQILIKDEDGITKAAWVNQWLRNNLKAQNLTIGDLVAITYLGKRKSNQGTEYNAWSVLVDK